MYCAREGSPNWDSSGDGDTVDLDNESDSDASPMNCDDGSVFMSASLFMSETGTVAVSPKAGVGGGGFAAQSPAAAAVTSTPVVTLSRALGQAKGDPKKDDKLTADDSSGGHGGVTGDDANASMSPAGAEADDSHIFGS